LEEYYFLDLSFIDVLASIVILLVIYFHASLKKSNNIDQKPYYSRFIGGAYLKIAGGIAFSFVYLFYYKGGDTIDYFSGAVCMHNLLFYDPIDFFDILFTGITYEKYLNYFNPTTLWPPSSLARKAENFNVIRVACLFSLVTFKSFLASTILFAYVCYNAIWRVYELFIKLFPGLDNLFAIAFLYTPSYLFWGSGIMKDTISIYAISIIVVAFYEVFIMKNRKFWKVFGLIAAAYLLFNIKPYLLVLLIPGLTFWGSFTTLQKVKSPIVKGLTFPVVLALSFFLLFSVYLRTGTGAYGSTEDALKKAQVIQQDLKRTEAYGDNMFDIGDFDPSISGVLIKLPVAVTAGLFMPFIWNARSVFMLFSGFENLILLLFTIYSLIRLRIVGLFRITFSDPILTFCFTFSFFVAFIIGLTTANYGALVRYKVPMLPFFTSFFIILTYASEEQIEKFKKAREKNYIPEQPEEKEKESIQYLPDSYLRAEARRRRF